MRYLVHNAWMEPHSIKDRLLDGKGETDHLLVDYGLFTLDRNSD